MGVRLLLVAIAAAVLAGAAAGATGPAAGSAAFLAGRQSANGGFAEQGRAPDGPLTAWAALGLVAVDAFPGRKGAVARVPARAHGRRLAPTRTLHSGSLRSPPSVRRSTKPCSRGFAAHRPGVLVNETIWTVIALRAAGEQPPPALVQAIVAAQAKGGGFAWSLRR